MSTIAFDVEVDILVNPIEPPTGNGRLDLAYHYDPTNTQGVDIVIVGTDPTIPLTGYVVTNVTYFNPPVVVSVPEPATWVLMLLGLACVAAKGVRKRAQ